MPHEKKLSAYIVAVGKFWRHAAYIYFLTFNLYIAFLSCYGSNEFLALFVIQKFIKQK